MRINEDEITSMVAVVMMQLRGFTKARPPQTWRKSTKQFNIAKTWLRGAHAQATECSEQQVSKSEQGRESITTGPKEFEISVQGKNPAFNYVSGSKSLRNHKVPTFKDFGLRDDILQGLDQMQICQPTVIQIKSIPEILKGSNVFCAAQTGSGKTLAYLAPIMNNLRRDEQEGSLTRYNRPRVCIISPYRELASQILKVVKTMSICAPVRSLGLIGGQKDHIVYKGLRERPIDIIVGTPGTILDLQAKNKLYFTDLKYVVFDEADTMLDSSFREMTRMFINRIRQRGVDPEGSVKHAQCIFAAAILPEKKIIGHIKSLMPKLKIVSADLHQVLPHVRHRFIKTSQTDKPKLLLKILLSRIEAGRKCMIFANSSATCKWLSNFLDEQTVNHRTLSGKIAPQERQDVFNEFQQDKSPVLVSTDIAARGLDTPNLFSVFNYDCPLNPTDYIHRAGRTGRARADYTGTPEVVTFLSRNWEVNLARMVEKAARKKDEIENVTVVRRKMLPLDIKR
eukprot:gene19035-20948_t